MAAIGEYYLIPPSDWLFPSHGDVVDAKRRAEQYFLNNGTYEGADFQIEEFVRQWALAQLLKAYHYPADWIGERITNQAIK